MALHIEGFSVTSTILLDSMMSLFNTSVWRWLESILFRVYTEGCWWMFQGPQLYRNLKRFLILR